MSVIDDTRKVLQDFLAPELRAVAVRLDSIEKKVDSLEKKVDDNERRAENRHNELLAGIREVGNSGSIRERLARIEERLNPHQ